MLYTIISFDDIFLNRDNTIIDKKEDFFSTDPYDYLRMCSEKV